MSLIAQQLSPLAVMTVICHYCSKPRHPKEVLYLGTGGAIMCWSCWEWHERAMSMLEGNPPPGCQECGITFDQLRERSATGDCRMYLHPSDGIYAVRCRACSDAYVPKRVDLYGPTQFGHNKKLK